MVGRGKSDFGMGVGGVLGLWEAEFLMKGEQDSLSHFIPQFSQ